MIHNQIQFNSLQRHLLRLMSGNNGTAIPIHVPQHSPYGYNPSRAAAITFVTLYAVSTLIHAAQAGRYRMWWLLPTACFCGLIEILGWSGRLWSTYDLFASTPFQIEITCTIVAPTPLLAANFVILAKMIKRLGTSYSVLTPKWYTIIFCTCDVISLFVQGIGGGLAATAHDLVGANKGAKIMLGGIVFQLIVIIVFSVCAIVYFVRYNEDSTPERSRGEFTGRLKLMSFALVFNTTCLFIRAIYRTIELSGGWDGRIIHTQVYFNVLDGVMVVLAIYTTNFLHPGVLLATHAPTKSVS